MSILPLMIFVIAAVVSIITIATSIRRYGSALRQARQKLENGRAQIHYRYSVISLDMAQAIFPDAIRQPAVRNLRSTAHLKKRKHKTALAKAA